MAERTRRRACGAVIRDNQILMVKHDESGRIFWTLPGGAVEDGETDEHAAEREVKEETGMDVRAVRFLFERSTRAPDGMESVDRCYLCEIAEDSPGPGLGTDPELADDEQVLVDCAWHPLATLAEDKQVKKVIAALGLKI